ncbi:hypothetical protein CERZMDRAFT_104638 [Cercospora zeae-maydis SCOH1-5]|uniref:Uncharacterized protein n=1 Tax=Cercospora zeae-maydis SCOH1-5 TaxID=717836 RepID=A0A6A6FRP1_9PEZI|nr:hypothetical protein CERZMDRAFT_104638 [Cercospora zeae-maydis SCOH1-5]
MPVIRPTALRSLQSALRSSGARATARAAPARTQLVAKRFASSGGHGGHGESSSDLPWLLAALAVTPPACWYLWPDNSSHGHGDHGSHGEHHEEKHGKEEEPSEEEEQASGGEEEAVENADEKKEDKPEIKEEDSEDKDEEKSEEKEEKKDDKKDEKEEKKDDKKDEKEEKKDDKEEGDEKSTEAPGRNTKERTFTVGAGEEKDPENVGASTSTSSKGQKLGETDSNAPAAKPRSKNDGDMSKKQEGMSNTDTKYSVPIDQGNEKSKKADGQPETAKSKGTVDPNAEGVKPPVARD